MVLGSVHTELLAIAIALVVIANNRYLPSANEVWGKVIFLQACVCPRGGVSGPRVVVPAPGGWWCLLLGGLVLGVPAPWGRLLRGIWSQGCLLPGGSAPGGYLLETPPTATTAGGTHPIGMHSCLPIFLHR